MIYSNSLDVVFLLLLLLLSFLSPFPKYVNGTSNIDLVISIPIFYLFILCYLCNEAWCNCLFCFSCHCACLLFLFGSPCYADEYYTFHMCQHSLISFHLWGGSLRNILVFFIFFHWSTWSNYDFLLCTKSLFPLPVITFPSWLMVAGRFIKCGY